MPTDEVLLITRLVTVNKGNQALSAAWLRMLQRAFPASAVRVLERRPRHLVQFTLRELATERNPVVAFERIAHQLAAMAPGSETLGPPTPTKIALDESVVATSHRFVDLRKRLNLRGYVARVGRYAPEFRDRLAAMQRARLVVVNPAGEFFPREPEPAFYHLLDAHVARLLGRPTAIVNHTMDIADPTLRKLIPVVYRDLALVGFRDAKSVDAFRAMGGDLANVLVTPDLALTSQIDGERPARRTAVAIAINVPEARANDYLAGWIDVIAGLHQSGVKVVLVSNELPIDLSFYDELRARFPGLTLEGAGLDYDRYAACLGSFDVVISSRMHTAVLAMVGGAAVVPVEGSSFKITGMFQELGVNRPVIRPGVAGWAQQVVDATQTSRSRRDAEAAELHTAVEQVSARISESLVPRLQAAARAAGES